METIASRFEVSRSLKALESIEADLARLTENLTECQFQAPPRVGGWSIGYCIEHLTLTGNGFLVEWDTALRAAALQGLKSDGPFPYSFLQRSILRFAEPPYTVKVKTTRPFAPYSRRAMDETLRRFRKMHYEMAACISASEGFRRRAH